MDASAVLQYLDSVHKHLHVPRSRVRVHVLDHDEWLSFMNCDFGSHTCGPYEPKPMTVMSLLRDIATLRKAGTFIRMFECRTEGTYLLVTRLCGKYVIVEVDAEMVNPEELFERFTKTLASLICDSLPRTPH